MEAHSNFNPDAAGAVTPPAEKPPRRLIIDSFPLRLIRGGRDLGKPKYLEDTGQTELSEGDVAQFGDAVLHEAKAWEKELQERRFSKKSAILELEGLLEEKLETPRRWFLRAPDDRRLYADKDARGRVTSVGYISGIREDGAENVWRYAQYFREEKREGDETVVTYFQRDRLARLNEYGAAVKLWTGERRDFQWSDYQELYELIDNSQLDDSRPLPY